MAAKAKIIVFGENGSETSRIEVLFNPKEYVIKYKTSYKKRGIVGTDTVITQFLHGDPAVLDVSLFFDESAYMTTEGRKEAKDISERVNQFIKLIYVDASLHRPPHIKFQWGSVNFKGIAINAATKYTKFDKEGMPTRATVDLSIQEVMDLQSSARKTPFESPDRTKCRVITAGKSLWNIAYEEYGNMEDWRVIASENKLINPLECKPGQMLKVPAL